MIGDDEYVEEQHHHHHQQSGPQGAQTPEDVRQHQVYPGYNYPPPPSVAGAAAPPPMHDARAPMSHTAAISARKDSVADDDRVSLFGDLSEGKKRKFILVEDSQKNQRVRVRVTLDTVDINEIPDSFRKSNSVYPRSWFPMQMQDPPPSSHGSRFFESDDQDDVDDKTGRVRRGRTMVSVPLADGGEAEVATPRMRKSIRSKEVKINELGYRMTWHQSRVFADKTVFLQKACQFLSLFYVPLSIHI